MLRSLFIRNLAVIDQLEVDFAAGMTVLTGETGAGKSILFDAIKLALGERADAGLVRAGAMRAEVVVAFEPDGLDAQRWQALIDEHELAAEDGELLIRRVVDAKGGSRAYVNDRPTTAALLKMLGAELVEIHGQHGQQRLLLGPEQRRLIDAFGAHYRALRDVQQAHRAWQQASAALAALAQQQPLSEAERELLQFQLDELTADALPADHYQALSEQHLLLANADRVRDALAGASAALDGDSGAGTQLAKATSALSSIADLKTVYAETAELLRNAQISLDEATSTLRTELDGVDVDDQQLAVVDDQLARIHRLARKHQCDPQALLDRQLELSDRLARAGDLDHQRDRLALDVANCLKTYRRLAKVLSAARRQAASALCELAGERLRTLAIPDAQLRFEIEHHPEAEPQDHGSDRITLQVRTNHGQHFGPLSKVASGGELSRIGLALALAAGEAQRVPTVLFDEVDSGVGGPTAQTVGQLLANLATDRQVLTVTHLPQVAACAQHQLHVAKRSDGKTTRTQITVLDRSERITELARMLSGKEATEAARQNAAALLADN